MHKKYKFYPNNIALVHSIEEHREVDRLAAWNKSIIIEMIENWISANEIISHLKSIDEKDDYYGSNKAPIG